MKQLMFMLVLVIISTSCETAPFTYEVRASTINGSRFEGKFQSGASEKEYIRDWMAISPRKSWDKVEITRVSGKNNPGDKVVYSYTNSEYWDRLQMMEQELYLTRLQIESGLDSISQAIKTLGQ